MAELKSLGKYEIRREIGRGAMGVVYEGFDPMIKRTVAIKTVRGDRLAGEESSAVIARFRREAQAAGRLSHPNIVSIYDFGEENGVWYIAMEFIKGRELKDYFDRDERFTLPDTARIMSQILDALGASHSQGVVHRDVKPANIFVLPDGNVKVADFGIAHIETSSMTQVGTVLGTPSYMSPEQIMGLPVDGRSDLFSAGVIFYQFLTGERPFAGSATTTMQKVLKEDPLPPSTLNVQAPAGMDAIVRKALAKRPDERFQTAAEFAAAIRGATQAPAATSSEATLVEPSQRTMASGGGAPPPRVEPPTPSAPLPPASPPSQPAKRLSPALIIGIVVAAIAIGAGAWYLKDRQDAGATKVAATPPAAPAAGAAPAVAAAAKPAPGTIVISAVGMIDPSDPRYQSDKSALQADLRADSRNQLVEKALWLLLDNNSVAKNYDVLKEKLLSKSASFIPSVLKESEPQLGKDGLMSMTTEAVVNVKAVQKSLNEMSRADRIEFIRASGDPKVSVRTSVRDADMPDAPPQPSPIAENILKERIKSFGFRTWAEGGPPDAAAKGADFAVIGEAKIKRLPFRLAASGVTMTKYAMTSWTVKCVDVETGEEIYYNNTLPTGLGSWGSEEEALKAIGTKIADEFSRDFFLQHVSVTGQKVTLNVEGLPSASSEEWLARELVALPEVITLSPRAPGAAGTFELQLGGSGSPGDMVANGVLKPLNRKLGQTCFSLGAVTGDRVSVVFDKRCRESSVLSRLETYPPAALYDAPPARQKAVVKNPEVLRKLVI
ncbi:MAG TPA: serine/threonine-protein kinase [Casimicrobiaceae bacterium]|nr:serine/threonine-protein kinase [Casimicrobiaceae bacterium]